MLELPAKDFEQVKRNPDSYAVVSDLWGNRYVVHRNEPSPLWAQLVIGAVLIGGLLLVLWLMDSLPF